LNIIRIRIKRIREINYDVKEELKDNFKINYISKVFIPKLILKKEIY